jgi:hypothetical protein
LKKPSAENVDVYNSFYFYQRAICNRSGTFPQKREKYREFLISDIFRRANEEAAKYRPLYRTWLGDAPEVNVLKPEHIEVLYCPPRLPAKTVSTSFSTLKSLEPFF